MLHNFNTKLYDSAVEGARKILFVHPIASSVAPVTKRVESFQDFFENSGLTIIKFNRLSFYEKICSLMTADLIFMTMPPFRNWLIVAFWGWKTLLDWRDGWSIAMRTGYGNTVTPSKVKAIFARVIELISILLCKNIIVCTKGLEFYHGRFLNVGFRKKLIFIPNGHNLSVDQARFKEIKLKSKKCIKLICAGKFGEYGKNKAHFALKTCLERYPGSRIDFLLIGADARLNNEVINSFKYAFERLNVKICEQISYEEIVSMIRDSDLAVAIIRDTDYDYGTKIFDYIASGIPILDYYDDASPFKEYFKGCFDTDYNESVAYLKACGFARKLQVKVLTEILLRSSLSKTCGQQ